MKRYLIGLVLLVTACGDKNNSISPTYKDLTEVVYASGNLYPSNEYKLSSNADGFLIERFVNPGDTVKANAALFIVDNELQLERLQNLERIYNKAKDNYNNHSPALQEALATQQTAQDKMKYDSQNYVRYKNLYDNNTIAKAQFDNVALAYQLSSNDFKLRKETFLRIKNQLFVDLQNAENNFHAAHKDLDNTTLRSDRDAKVYDVLREKGESVRRNDVIAILGDINNPYLKLVIDELDIEKVKVGQEVFVKMDIAPDKVYKAKVSKIYPRLNKEDQSFRVDASFIGDIPESLYGVTVEANILVNKKSHVLSIPKSVIEKGDSVSVKRGGQTVKIKITKGLESFEDVEVLSGITIDDELLIKK